MRFPHPFRNYRAEGRRITENYRSTLGDQIATLNTRIVRQAVAVERYQRDGTPSHSPGFIEAQERLYCDRGQRDEYARQLHREERRMARRSR
jgi:hypothetical protein